MHSQPQTFFPQEPAITLYDPLADLLGAGDGHFTYTFDDAVKLSGHACPTVAGAFLLVKVALDHLYPNQTPTRGEIGVALAGGEEEGVNGPMSQVYTLLTGAAARQGFQGLGGQHVRKDLLQYKVKGADLVTFTRRDTGASVTLTYSPAAIPAAGDMGEAMRQILYGSKDPQVKEQFSTAWRQRVLAILADGGKRTIQVV
ncbi:MAG: hypothetical protein HQL72_12775 [Magnetococcales bacterium]|nr:hypothetical protein [Magnetococcales bacterium]